MTLDPNTNPPDDREARITALLLGQLPDSEAADLRRQIKGDPELARLTHRLKLTIDLLNAAAAEGLPAESTTSGKTGEPNAPKLSAERRERLFAEFKTVRVPTFSRADRQWSVLVAAAAILMLLACAALFLPRANRESATYAAAPTDPNYKYTTSTGEEGDTTLNLGLLPDGQEHAQYLVGFSAGDKVNRFDEQRKLGVVHDSKQQSQEKLAPTERFYGGFEFRRGAAVASDSLAAGTAATPAPGGPTPDENSLAVATPKTDVAAVASVAENAPQQIEMGRVAGESRARAAIVTPTPAPAQSAPVPAKPPPAAQPAREAQPGDLYAHFDRGFGAGGIGGGGAGGAPKTPALKAEGESAADKPVMLGTELASKPAELNVNRRYGLSAGQAGSAGVVSEARDLAAQIETPALQTSEGKTVLLNDSLAEVETLERKQIQVTTNSVLGGSMVITQDGLHDFSTVNSDSLRQLYSANTFEDAKSAAGRSQLGDISKGAQTDWYLRKNLGEDKEERMKVRVLDEKAKKDFFDDDANGRPSQAGLETPPEVQTAQSPFSTFSLNVADVSFRLAEASLQQNRLPDAASIRSEEFINAFDYRDPEPAPGQAVGFAWERARYPFAHNRELLRFSVKASAQGRQAGRALNLVLLVDNSGSMERADRVQIIRESFRVLATQLQPHDKVSIVLFSRTPRLVAEAIPGNQFAQRVSDLSSLTPEGGTNLEEALKLAYQAARHQFAAGAINRVVLLTDGAANLGNVEAASLKKMVEDHRRQDIALDCFGIGWEGYNDDLLEELSRNGDGRYAFINTPEEAASDFAGKLAGALQVAASDVKVQIEFNPKRVTAYRQIGYAKHQLTKEQFRDNTVDAAEIAAAESGNALYVVEVNPGGSGPLGTVRVRYKAPGTADYREQEWALAAETPCPALDQSTPAMRLAASAAAFAEWLARSPHAAEVTPDRLQALLHGVPGSYPSDTRPAKLRSMIQQARSIAGE